MTRARRGGFFPPDDEAYTGPRARGPEGTAGGSAHPGWQPRATRTYRPMVPAPPAKRGWWIAHRGKVGLLVLGLALAGGYAFTQVDVARWLAGEGYVRWRTVRWQASQLAVQHDWPLVIHTVDPRHPDHDALRARILSVHRIQDLGSSVAWHRAELSPAQQAALDAPAPPTVAIWRSDGMEILEGPVPVAELTPDAFESMLLRAKEELGRGGEPTRAGFLGW